MVTLEEITPDNWRTDLKVAGSQQACVADRVTILARAYAYRNFRSRAWLICDGETPVGIAMYYDEEEPYSAYDLSQFFIDERYQGRGYGTAALALILDLLRADGKYKKVELCYTAGNEAARKFYEKAGFQVLDDGDEEEITMTLAL